MLADQDQLTGHWQEWQKENKPVSSYIRSLFFVRREAFHPDNPIKTGLMHTRKKGISLHGHMNNFQFARTSRVAVTIDPLR